MCLLRLFKKMLLSLFQCHYLCFITAKMDQKSETTQLANQQVQIYNFQKQLYTLTSIKYQPLQIPPQRMDVDSWQDKAKSSKLKNKSKTTDIYDDDFQEESTTKNKSKQVDLPKIHKNKPKIDSRSNSKPQQAIQQEGEDDPYADDFQQPSNKKLPQNHQKSKNKIDHTTQKFSPQVNKKASKPYNDSEEDQQNQKKPNQASGKSPQNDMKLKSKPSSPKALSKNKKSSSSTQVKLSPHQAQVLTKKPSQSVMKNNSLQIESKYINYLKTQFPHTREEVLQFPPEKVNRLNEKLRSYIKKVNDELTDLINENMRLIKIGAHQSKTEGKTADDVVKMLMEQKKNGETYIETVEKQCSNLAQQWEKVRNSDVQGTTQQQILQISQKIKQHTKDIGVLKYDMKMEGNKLVGENNYVQKMAELKGKLSIVKREQEKYAEKLQKCFKNAEQLQAKNPQIDIQLQKLLQQAKRQKIVLIFSPADKKRQEKYEQLKKKAQNIRNHQQKTQSLCETKNSLLKKQIDNISSQIASIDTRFTQFENTLHSTQQNSVQLIQQSKKRVLQPYVQTHLDFIYKNIKEGNPLTVITLLKPSNSKQKAELKKYASSANVKGFLRSQSDAELKPSFHITKKGPLEIKTKQKVSLKLGQKNDTTPIKRVWKGDSKQIPATEGSKQVEEPNSSKPFVIRRSQNVSPVPSQVSNKKLQATIKQSSQKENENSTSIMGPKKLFKKAETVEVKNQKSKQAPVITQKNANEPVQKQNEQEGSSKPQFKIKKAKKSIVQIPDQDLYLFPPGTKKDIKEVEQPKQQPNNSPKNNLVIDPPKQTAIKVNNKGPNFKPSAAKDNQKGIQLKLSLEQNNEKTLLTNVQVSQNKTQQIKKESVTEEQSGLNIGGRRQVQRKLQRKNQDSYVV